MKEPATSHSIFVVLWVLGSNHGREHFFGTFSCVSHGMVLIKLSFKTQSVKKNKKSRTYARKSLPWHRPAAEAWELMPEDQMTRNEGWAEMTTKVTCKLCSYSKSMIIANPSGQQQWDTVSWTLSSHEQNCSKLALLRGGVAAGEVTEMVASSSQWGLSPKHSPTASPTGGALGPPQHDQ